MAAAAPARVVWVILEQCSLETVKTKKGFELLNCDEHQGICKRAGRDPADNRPDIVHQVLLALLDSPLNKAGCLRIFMQTKKQVLIEVSPHTRIPRTFKRFAGLMVQLLHNLRVRAADGSDTLLKVTRNPVTAHLPVGCPVVGLEVGAELVDPFDLPRVLGCIDAPRAGGRALQAAAAAAAAAGAAAVAGAGAVAAAAAGAVGGGKGGRKRLREETGGASAGAAPTPAPVVDAVAERSSGGDVAFVIGAMSHGNIAPNYITRTFSTSRYALSAACTVSKLLNAFEHAWGVL